jgi:putative ABC transport system permease protein
MIQPVRNAIRSLRRSPGYTAGAVLALSLGIGATTAVFSVVRAILLEPLAYPRPDELVRIWETNPSQGIEHSDVSAGTFVDLRARASTIDRAALFMARGWLVSFGAGGESDMEIVPGAIVSPALFPLLGVAPILGRTFKPEEEQPAPYGDSSEIVIGYGLWQRRFGGRPDVLGRTIRFEGNRALTIVGVMPPGFDFPAKAEYWRNVAFRRTIGPGERAARYYEGIARLKAGVSLDRARTEVGAIAAQLEAEHPRSNAGYGMTLERLDSATVGSVKPALVMLLGAVACLMLIGCTNVANLALARAIARRKEIALRAALGASRWRLVRESLGECALIGVLGATTGSLIGYAGMQRLVSLAPPETPRLDEVVVGWPTFALATGLAALAVLLAAVAPLTRRRSLDLSMQLEDGGRDGRAIVRAGLRSWLIGAEAALALVLLVLAALLLRSFVALRHVDLGFESAQVLTANLRLSTDRFPEAGRRPWFRLAGHYDRLLSDLRAIPGVEAAAAITDTPLTGQLPTGRFWMDDGADAPPDGSKQFDVAISVVTPSYFDVMAIPMVRGRRFEPADRFPEAALTQAADTRRERPRGVVIINDAMARRYWPGQDPVGRSIVLADHWAARASTIVGVVRDVRAAAVDATPAPTVYAPLGELAGFGISVALRSRVPLAPLGAALRERIRGFDPHMVVTEVRSLEDVVAGATATPRFNLTLAATFAALALALAAIGIHGVIAYLVTRRTHEIGVRMALGASRTGILWLVLREGLMPVVLGAAVGSIAAFAAARLIRALLFGIAPLDPWSFGAAAAAMMAAGLAAAIAPALRATRVDPLAALRRS